jgi:SHS2 domain-containing protein
VRNLRAEKRGIAMASISDYPFGGVTRGHRTVQHFGDCIVDAWGDDESSCFAEAVIGLAESFVRPAPSAERTRRAVSIGPRPPDEALVALLDEAIYGAEVRSEIPVGAELVVGVDGSITGTMEVVSSSDVELIGPVPKAASYHGLTVRNEGGSWRCLALIDR